MSWNYRIVQLTKGTEPYFGLHEVYYTDGVEDGYTCDPVGFVGETREEVIASLKLALKDAETRPVYVPKEEV